MELDFKYPESIVMLALMDNRSLRSFGGLKNAVNLRYLSVYGGILPEKLECRSNSVYLSFYQCKGTAFPKLDIPNIPVLKCVCNYDMADLSSLQGKKIGWLVVSRCAFLDEEDLSSLAGLDVELLNISFYKDGDMEGELIDPSNEPHVSDNVYSAVYQEELCGYMAGFAAVKLGYTKLGFLGGMAVPAVIRYGSGFVQGANAAAEELGTDIEINYVYGGQFYGDGDITAAMDTWYKGGTEVVFACGGGIFTSAGEAAAKVGGKVIGVDVDQAATIDGMYGEGMTVTSAMKGLAATVDTLLGEIVAGNWKDYGGQIQNLGLVGEDPELNYVQIPMESTQWSDSFTKEDYAALVAAMFAGDVEVSNDITALPAVGSHVTLNDQGQIK